jgi:hypothetical protein
MSHPAQRFAAPFLVTDKELTSNVLAKHLRIGDRKVLDAAYDGKINVMEPRSNSRRKPFRRCSMRRKNRARAKNSIPRPQRYINGMEKNGLFDKLWAGK